MESFSGHERKVLTTSAVVILAGVLAVCGIRYSVIRQELPVTSNHPALKSPTPTITVTPSVFPNKDDAVAFYFQRATVAASIDQQFTAIKQPTLAAISRNEGLLANEAAQELSSDNDDNAGNTLATLAAVDIDMADALEARKNVSRNPSALQTVEAGYRNDAQLDSKNATIIAKAIMTPTPRP